MDEKTTLAELKEAVLQMALYRGWGDENGIQNPQQMAMAMSVELGEMMEHFAWLDADGVRRLLAGELPNRRNRIAEEFADVLIYGLQVMNALGVDISDTVLKKIEIVKRRATDPDAGRTHPHVDTESED
ncbi:MAG: MazG-like family protein [Clostridia bacterium]|nr:MazG-like family protein [Clostridia bacterium]